MIIALSGLGKAGKALVSSLDATRDELAVAVCRPESASSGCDVGEVLELSHVHAPVLPASAAAKVIRGEGVDVLIDFSHQAFTRTLVELCVQTGASMVICTTNHSDDDLRYFRNAAARSGIGIAYAPNLTLGINLLMGFAKKLGQVLPHFDFAIVERHRKSKPPISATARMIAGSVEGHDVPIACVRAGEYVGVHELTAAGANERITITHEAFSRNAFADGALFAARFVQGKTGFYTMEDVMASLELNQEDSD